MGLWLTFARLFRLLVGVSAVSFGWDIHQQSQKGKSWDITWLLPLFRSWLDVYGVTQADLSIQKAPKKVKEGGWVFRARHVHWLGGTIQDIAFHFVWRKGPKLKSLKAKGMNITQWPSMPVSSSRCDLDIQDISLPVNTSLGLLSPLLLSPHDRYHLSRSGDQLIVDRSIPNGRSLRRTPWLRAKITVKNSSYVFSGTFQHTLVDLSTGSPLSPSLSKINTSIAPKAVNTADSALIPTCFKGTFQGWVRPPSLGSTNLWTWKGECHGKQEGTVAWGAQTNRNSVSDLSRDKGWAKGRWHITTSHLSPLKAQWSAHFFNNPVNGSITVGPANLSREHPWSLSIHHAKGNLPIGTWLSLWPNQIPARQTKVWLTKHFDKGPVTTIDVLIKGLVRPSTSLFLSESKPHAHHAPPQHVTEITAPSSKTTPLTHEPLPKLQQQPAQQPAQPRVNPTTAVPSPSLSLTPSSTPMISVTSLKGGVSLCDLTLNAWDKIPLLQHLDVQADFDLKGVNINIRRGQFTDHSLQGKVSILWDKHPSVLSFETSLSGPLKSLLQVALSLFPKRLAWGIRQAQGTTRTQIKGLIPLDPSSSPIDIDVESKGSGLSAICDTKPWAWHLKQHSMHAHWRQGVLTLSGDGIVNNAPAGWRWADNALTFHARMTPENLKDLLSFWPSWVWFGPRASVSGRYTDKDLRVVADLTQCQCRFPGIKNPKKPGSPWSLTYLQTSNQGKLWSKGRWCDLTAHWVESPTQSLAGARLQADKTWAEYQYTNPKKFSPLLLSSKNHQTQRMWDVFTEQGSHRFFLHSDDVLDLRSAFPKKKQPSKNTPPSPTPSSSHMTSSSPANSVFFDVSVTTPLLYVHTGTFRDVKFRLQGEAPSLIPGNPRSWWSWYTWKEGQIRAIQRTKKAKMPKDGQIIATISTRNTGQTDVLAQVLNVGAVCNGLGLSYRILHGDLMCSLQQKKPGSGYHGQLSISNIKIKSSSLGKMLALLSPTLFIDVFSSGIKFYQIDSSFVLKADEVTIQKLIARGYNLGTYLKGSITTKSPYPCSFKGVAIPAYFWNAFFRRWPLLGRLLGGNNGIVSSEFVMTGPLTKPVVKIKPFSLLKLGLLKKLFKKLFKKRSCPKLASPPSRP